MDAVPYQALDKCFFCTDEFFAGTLKLPVSNPVVYIWLNPTLDCAYKCGWWICNVTLLNGLTLHFKLLSSSRPSVLPEILSHFFIHFPTMLAAISSLSNLHHLFTSLFTPHSQLMTLLPMFYWENKQLKDLLYTPTILLINLSPFGHTLSALPSLALGELSILLLKAHLSTRSWLSTTQHHSAILPPCSIASVFLLY